MQLPDFVIIGAMKCGTTTLQSQLAAQPGVFMSTPKEPNFFSDDPIYAQGTAWYSGLFEEAPAGSLKGEASTHYTKLPTHPHAVARMAELLPDVRLVYMIRDPIARAVSHYIHGWSRKEINTDFHSAFDQHPELIAYGCYGMQIAPYLDTFGVDRVLLTSLEALKGNPQGELGRVADFLGLPGPVSWIEDHQRENASDARFRQLPMQKLLVDNPVARVLRQTLIPKSWRARVRAARGIGERPDLTEDLRHRLEEAFRQDHALLATQFPDHPALRDAYPFLAP